MFAFHLGLAFCVTVVLIHIFKHVADTVGLVDNPREHKIHKGQVPLVGGIAVFTAFFFMVLLLPHSLQGYRALFLGVGLLVIIGVMDDFKSLTARGKLPMQILAAVIVAAYGDVIIHSVGNLFGTGVIILGNWAIPFTILCIVGMINATNMLDGLDGLAGGVVLVALLYFATGYALLDNMVAMKMSLILAAAILGFLLFNIRHPWQDKAQVFLGDAGSMPLGLVLSWFAIDFAQQDSHVPPICVVWILGLPLMDMVILTLRRISKRQNPLAADQTHIHHVLLKHGMQMRYATLSLIGLSALFGGIGLLGWVYNWPEYLMSGGYICTILICYFATKQSLERT